MIANQMDVLDWAIAVVCGVQLDVGLLGEHDRGTGLLSWLGEHDRGTGLLS